MKRIKVTGPVVLMTSEGSMVFRPGQSYDVSDEVEDHPWLSNHLLERLDLESDQAPAKQETKRARTKRISKPLSDVSA